MSELISIVVPCYNEQESLPIFYNTIVPILTNIKCSYELIFVDDGSKDDTSKIMKNLAEKDKNVKYIIFSRNFGKESAMYAGLEGATGDYVAVMDVDLQDPPEKLVEMYSLIKNEGYDCVATRRVTRKGEPKIRSWFARMFYKIINKYTQCEIVDGARDFRLMKRKMVDAILKMQEYNRFSKGIFSWAGFKVKWLEYENIERVAGETKWNFKKLFVYAIEGFMSFTLAPLYFIIKFGLSLLLLDILAIIILTICHFVITTFVYSNTLILITIFTLLISLLIICLGICAMYQAKIYTECKKRPIYITSEDNLKKK